MAVNNVLAVVFGLSVAGAGFASGQVSSIQTRTVPATALVYTAGGVEYRWGMGSNQLMEGFATPDGHLYSYALSADRVEIRRDDIAGVATGEPCGIFVERLSDGDASRTFASDYPGDDLGSGNCDISNMLASRVLNRGAIDLFSNTVPDAKNVERLDYLFDYGVLAPLSEEAMQLAGHVAAEKSSNNPIKIAAILALDVLGQPSAYGPLIRVGPDGCSAPDICYGFTDVHHTYSFLQNDLNEPQSFPVETERSHETVGMALISAADLGLKPGQRYYGFSFFADDVDSNQHNLLDPASFPDDTAADNVVPGDDADIYGGLSGFFVADAVVLTQGAVFNDVNGNGMPDDAEAGISDISISIYKDVNGNGVLDEGVDKQIGDSIDSDMSGNFVLPGLADGYYLVVMDESDPELPVGLQVATGANPHPLIVAGADPEAVYFPFMKTDGSDGGGTAGSTDSGTSDGGATAGTTDSGTSDGGATAGTTDSGTSDGGATAGTTDSGTSDGGATTGTTDSGTDDGGSTTSGVINDGTTKAVDDTFEVNQGRATVLDVLANDIDSIGDGLTLLSASSTPNATITVVNNQLDYRPNFSFYGMDTFLYEMEDADGNRLTGNVAVNVVRYSDLNNNMVNDFVECNCNDLTLQTGIHGSGVGRVSFLGAWVLLISVWLRRRVRGLKARVNETASGDL